MSYRVLERTPGVGVIEGIPCFPHSAAQLYHLPPLLSLVLLQRTAPLIGRGAPPAWAAADQGPEGQTQTVDLLAPPRLHYPHSPAAMTQPGLERRRLKGL